jgi:hypothetical protein
MIAPVRGKAGIGFSVRLLVEWFLEDREEPLDF